MMRDELVGGPTSVMRPRGGLWVVGCGLFLTQRSRVGFNLAYRRHGEFALNLSVSSAAGGKIKPIFGLP
jgi:hypothetical protein